MRGKLWVALVCCLLLVLAGCRKRETAQPVPISSQESNRAQIDVCGLLTKEEIEAIQGSPIKETKSSARSDGTFRVSQCFYTATEFSRSVSLAVMQRGPGRPTTTSPKDFWKERFARYSDEKERDKVKEGTEGKEEKEESVPPRKIDGIGDEAFWASNRFGGVLYVLKGDAFISISVGGPDNEETKLQKSKALAKKALQRL